MPSVISSLRGGMALNGPSPPRFDVSWSRTITKGRPMGILWTSDQLITKAATYTIQNKHKRRISMPSLGFEPDIPPIKRPHTHALDNTATGISVQLFYGTWNVNKQRAYPTSDTNTKQ
jgi:hypothetical protein